MDLQSPILEAEDRRFIDTRLHTEAAPSLHQQQPPSREENLKDEPPYPHINDHAVFWSTYDKATAAYD
ncbi:hypothetical protein FRC02_007746, partial [Tulasnella sp. 418]